MAKNIEIKCKTNLLQVSSVNRETSLWTINHFNKGTLSSLVTYFLSHIIFHRQLEAKGALTSQWLGCWSPKSPNGRDAAAALSPKLVSLHDLHSGLLLAAAAALSPKPFSLHDLHSGLLLAAAAALSPKLVPLHDLHSGRLFPFMIFLLGCPWLLLPPCLQLVCLHDFPSGLLLAAALSPKLIPLWDFPSGCSWLPLPPCLPSLSLFMISIVGFSWLPLLPCLPSLLRVAAAAFPSKLVSLPDFPFGLLLAAAAALSPSWFPFLISLLSCSWLPLPPYLLACFPSRFCCLRKKW